MKRALLLILALGLVLFLALKSSAPVERTENEALVQNSEEAAPEKISISVIPENPIQGEPVLI